jgi:BA14K-like protein
MKRLLSLQTELACRAGVLGCVFLAVMSCAALAQTTGAVNPTPAPAEPPVKEEPAPGGCMPIGVTVSGEIVFPFQCKEFIERRRAADQRPAAEENQKPIAANQKPDAEGEKTVAKQSAATEMPAIAEVKPAAAEEKPVAAEEKTAAKQQESVVPENSKPATEAVGTIPLPKRAEREAQERTIGPPGCTHFRSYDPASGTYRTYDRQRHQCREVVGQSFRK